MVRVRPINNQWRRKVRGLYALHRRSLQRLSITKINLPRNLHSGKSDPTHPSLLGIVGKFNDFVSLVPRAAGARKPENLQHVFGECCFAPVSSYIIILYKFFLDLNKSIEKFCGIFVCIYSYLFELLSYCFLKFAFL